MAWVVSRIIGDGQTPATAFRTAAQAYPITILNADCIPVNLKTGFPVASFALLQVKDGDEALLQGEPGCFVLPSTVSALKTANVITRLQAQGCPVDLSGVKNVAEAVAALKALAGKQA